MNYRGLLLLRFRMDALLKYQGNYGNVEKWCILGIPSINYLLKFFLGSRIKMIKRKEIILWKLK